VMVGDPVRCKSLTDRLLAEFALYVQPINFPTVPRGLERIRLTPGPLHGEYEIARMVEALDRLWSKMTLARAA
jgi:5-aminolevulinate synthase